MRAVEFTNFNYKTELYEGWNGDGIVVRAYDGKDEVGRVIFEPTEDDASQWYAIDVEVEEPYQRKGIATKMYDIAKKAAKQQGAIIVKSHTQTDAGRGLWQDKKVWEQQNITESKTVEYEGLTLKISKNGHQLMVNALDDWGNKVLGHVTFNIGDGKELDPQDLKVDDKYQGQGIAKVMYDYVKSLGYTIARSYDQTDAGAGFWNKHRGEDVRIWEAFDKPYKTKSEKSEYGDVDMLAKLPDGTNLSIMFNKGYDGDDVLGYDVEFYRNNSQEVTGEGDAYNILATVLASIQKFVKKYKPESIRFSVNNEPEVGVTKLGAKVNPESCVKLYNRMVQRYAGAMGYNGKQQEGHGFVWYTLRRTEQGVAEENELEEDWKSALATGAMTGAMAMGAQAKAPDIVQQTVEPGDTVYSIARQNNVNPLEIYKLNKMDRSTKLEVGQKVLVPDYSKPVKPAQSVAQPTTSFKDKITSMIPKFSRDNKEEEGVTLLSDNSDAEAAIQTAAKAAGLKGAELAQFMAQTRHESWDFGKMKEVGSKKQFNKYEAPRKAKQLGNKVKGDGERFKGRGFIQLTGRDNYTRASQQLFGDDRLVKNPDLASRLDIGAQIALWFWKNQVRPNVKNFNNTKEVTNAINPGLSGLQDRHNKFKEYMAVL